MDNVQIFFIMQGKTQINTYLNFGSASRGLKFYIMMK